MDIERWLCEDEGERRSHDDEGAWIGEGDGPGKGVREDEGD